MDVPNKKYDIGTYSVLNSEKINDDRIWSEKDWK
jgi:hypothetical protein